MALAAASVLCLTACEEKQEGPAILAMPGISAPSYQQVAALAEKILAGTGDLPVLVCLEADMAKALGQALALRSSPQRQILCLIFHPALHLLLRRVFHRALRMSVFPGVSAVWEREVYLL